MAAAAEVVAAAVAEIVVAAATATVTAVVAINSNGGSGGIGSKDDSIVICRTTAAMRGEHINQPKKGHAAKMPVTKASNRQQPAGTTKGQEGGATQLSAQQQQRG